MHGRSQRGGYPGFSPPMAMNSMEPYLSKTYKFEEVEEEEDAAPPAIDPSFVADSMEPYLNLTYKFEEEEEGKGGLKEEEEDAAPPAINPGFVAELMPGNRHANGGGLSPSPVDAATLVDAIVEESLERMGRRSRPPSPHRSGEVETGTDRCIRVLNLFLALINNFQTSVVKPFIFCVSFSQCMSGWCAWLSCIFQPFVWAWDCLIGDFGYMKAAGVVLQFAWQCVQFWTPLSITFLFLWLLYRPDRFHPYVDDAVLAAFDLTNANDKANSSLLQYDLSVGLSFRNSHSRLSIRYLDVGATVFYNGTKIGSAVNSLPSFRQPPKNTTVWRPAFQGAVTAFSGEVAAQLGRELAAGVVHVRVAVYLTLMYKVWPVKDVVFYKYDCWLWFSPPRKDAPALFHGNGTKCWRV